MRLMRNYFKTCIMIRACPGDKYQIVDILSNAFEDNKSVNYIIQQDIRRKERIRKLMAYSFDVCYLYGDIFLTDNRKACALILLPDKKKTTIHSVFLNIPLATAVIGLRNIKKAMNREASISKIHPEGMLYYLWFIGVQRSEQGKGIGSRLLTQISKTGLAQKRTICLETSTLQNLPWYEKHGFKTYRELDFGYKLYCMKKS